MSRPSKAWSAAFHGPAFASGAGRVQAHDGQVDALEGGLVGGEVSPGPDGLADPRVDALDRVGGADDLADLHVEPEEGHELRPGRLPEPDDRRILPAPGAGELHEPLQRGLLGRRGVDGPERLRDLLPVLPRRVAKAVPQQVNDAGLDDRRRPDGVHGVREAGQAVADQHQNVGRAAVLDLGQDLEPVPCALAAVADPQAQDVPVTLGGDRHRHADGPVGDLPVPDLHVRTVDEDDPVDAVQRTVLSFRHAGHHAVGDRGDRGLGDLRAVHLGEMRGDLPARQSLRRQRQDHLVHPAQTPLTLLDQLRLERPCPVPRHTAISTGPDSVITVLERCPFR